MPVVFLCAIEKSRDCALATAAGFEQGISCQRRTLKLFSIKAVSNKRVHRHEVAADSDTHGTALLSHWERDLLIALRRRRGVYAPRNELRPLLLCSPSRLQAFHP